MSNKITFTDAYELLTEQEYALLQKGIFLGMDAHQKTVKFCSGLKMNQDLASNYIFVWCKKNTNSKLTAFYIYNILLSNY